MSAHDKPEILLVDDEPQNTQILRDFLEFEGFAVTLAANGREALDRIEVSPPDLVITDYDMPVMDGFELVKAVCRGYPDLPVIMLTGQYRQDMEKAIATLKEGASDYLTKPVDLDRLGRSMATALQVSQARRERRVLTEALERAHAQLNREKEKLEELTRIHNDLLTIVSRDLEAPLIILTGSCKMLLRDGASRLPPVDREMVELIGRQGDKIQGIIDDLMDLARVETDAIQLKPVEVFLHPLLEKCRANLQPVAAAKAVTTTLQPPAGLKPVFADEGRIKQVLFNLLHQAVLFADPGQTLRIGILPQGRGQRVEILFRSRAFPMEAVRGLLSDREGEPGLDKRARYRLILCREIAELHEGHIGVEEGLDGEVLLTLEIPIRFTKEGSRRA